jgi:hypothetical protein
MKMTRMVRRKKLNLLALPHLVRTPVAVRRFLLHL